MKSWGIGPFDNAVAQELAFQMTANYDVSDWPLPLTRWDNSKTDVSDFFQAAALAEIVVVLSGRSKHISGCPVLSRWITDHSPSYPDLSVREKLADRLSNLFLKTVESEQWTDKQQKVLQKEISETVVSLKSSKKPRKIEPGNISLRELKRTVELERPGREPGNLYPMKRRSKNVHVNASFLEPETAIKMTQYPFVSSLSIMMHDKVDEAKMELPVRLLLRGWSKSLKWLEFDVAKKNWNSGILKSCIDEIEQLSNLQCFKTIHFDISDSVVIALAGLGKISEIRLSQSNGPSVKCLPHLKESTLKIFWCRGSRISRAKAAGFSENNPHIQVDIA